MSDPLTAAKLYNIYTSPVDKRSSCRRVVDTIKAIFKEFFCGFRGIYKAIFPGIEIPVTLTSKPTSKGLFVLAHGLMADPTIFDKHVRLIGKEYDVWAPKVKAKGVCPLAEATDPIYEQLKEYIQKNPGKKICLVGYSNGGRIVSEMESRLRSDFPKTPVRVTTIAGVHMGAPVQRLVRWWKIDRCISPTLSEEMAYESKKSKEVFGKMKEPCPEGVQRSYEFYGSLDDLVVPPASSMPTMGKGEVHRAVTGVGHCAIIQEVAAEQVASAKEWFQ